MRISDWSSDVCSSDLAWQQRVSSRHMGALGVLSPHITTRRGYLCVMVAEVECIAVRELCTAVVQPDRLQGARFVVADWCLLPRTTPDWSPLRSEESRVGKECVSTGRSRGTPSK